FPKMASSLPLTKLLRGCVFSTLRHLGLLLHAPRLSRIWLWILLHLPRLSFRGSRTNQLPVLAVGLANLSLLWLMIRNAWTACVCLWRILSMASLMTALAP